MIRIKFISMYKILKGRSQSVSTKLILQKSIKNLTDLLTFKTLRSLGEKQMKSWKIGWQILIFIDWKIVSLGMSIKKLRSVWGQWMKICVLKLIKRGYMSCNNMWNLTFCTNRFMKMTQNQLRNEQPNTKQTLNWFWTNLAKPKKD